MDAGWGLETGEDVLTRLDRAIAEMQAVARRHGLRMVLIHGKDTFRVEPPSTTKKPELFEDRSDKWEDWKEA